MPTAPHRMGLVGAERFSPAAGLMESEAAPDSEPDRMSPKATLSQSVPGANVQERGGPGQGGLGTGSSVPPKGKPPAEAAGGHQFLGEAHPIRAGCPSGRER